MRYSIRWFKCKLKPPKNLPFFFFFVGTSSFYFLEITATQIQDIEVYLSVNVVLKAGATLVSHKDLK